MCTIDVHFEFISQKQDCIHTGRLLFLKSEIASAIFKVALYFMRKEVMKWMASTESISQMYDYCIIVLQGGTSFTGGRKLRNG